MSSDARRPLAIIVLFQSFWGRLATRERTLVGLAAMVVGVGALWWIALQPALKTLRDSPAVRTALDHQLQQVLRVSQQAKAIESLAPVTREEALRLIESTAKSRLGATTQVVVQGDRVVITVRSVTGDALAEWLTQVRVNARAMPSQVQLRRTTPAPPALWEGTISFSFAAR